MALNKNLAKDTSSQIGNISGYYKWNGLGHRGVSAYAGDGGQVWSQGCLACHPIPHVEAESGVVTALLGDSLLGEHDPISFSAQGHPQLAIPGGSDHSCQ
jgi:hypothetical protein